MSPVQFLTLIILGNLKCLTLLDKEKDFQYQQYFRLTDDAWGDYTYQQQAAICKS